MQNVDKHIADIAQYVDQVNEQLVSALYASLEPILGNRDAAYVSCGDENELTTVKRNFIQKKLGITDEQKADAAIAAVCERMKGDNSKHRITFYYLLTEELGAANAILDS